MVGTLGTAFSSSSYSKATRASLAEAASLSTWLLVRTRSGLIRQQVASGERPPAVRICPTARAARAPTLRNEAST